MLIRKGKQIKQSSEIVVSLCAKMKPDPKTESNSRYLVIINPVAGQKDSAHIREEIEEWFVGRDIDYDLKLTRGKGDALEWSRGAKNYRCVVAAGGDGTMMEVITGLVKNKSKTPLLTVPTGTANLLSLAAGIPSDVIAALNLLEGDSSIVSFDAGFLPEHDRYFALVAGAGWDAQMIDDASRKFKNYFGFGAYLLSGLKNIFLLKNARIELKIDGKLIIENAHTVVIANFGRIHGTTISIAESITPHDGVLNVVLTSRKNGFDLLRILLRVLGKGSVQSPLNRCYSGKVIELKSNPKLKFQIDGECISNTPVRIQVQSDACQMIVPQSYKIANQLGNKED